MALVVMIIVVLKHLQRRRIALFVGEQYRLQKVVPYHRL
jgi:hypothetical protein